jgi:hypothetical protein
VADFFIMLAAGGPAIILSVRVSSISLVGICVAGSLVDATLLVLRSNNNCERNYWKEVGRVLCVVTFIS